MKIVRVIGYIFSISLCFILLTKLIAFTFAKLPDKFQSIDRSDWPPYFIVLAKKNNEPDTSYRFYPLFEHSSILQNETFGFANHHLRNPGTELPALREKWEKTELGKVSGPYLFLKEVGSEYTLASTQYVASHDVRDQSNTRWSDSFADVIKTNPLNSNMPYIRVDCSGNHRIGLKTLYAVENGKLKFPLYVEYPRVRPLTAFVLSILGSLILTTILAIFTYKKVLNLGSGK